MLVSYFNWVFRVGSFLIEPILIVNEIRSYLSYFDSLRYRSVLKLQVRTDNPDRARHKAYHGHLKVELQAGKLIN